MQALALFRKLYPNHRKKEVDHCISRAISYIENTQYPDGSWYFILCITPQFTIYLMVLDFTIQIDMYLNYDLRHIKWLITAMTMLSCNYVSVA